MYALFYLYGANLPFLVDCGKRKKVEYAEETTRALLRSARVYLRQALCFSFEKGMPEEPHRPLHPSVSIDDHQIA